VLGLVDDRTTPWQAAKPEYRRRFFQQEPIVVERDPADSSAATQVPEQNIVTRAELLPEELAVGSDDPQAQAAAILLESENRIEDPDAGL
jgi:hypothetical protein